jgi:hypothetical protein
MGPITDLRILREATIKLLYYIKIDPASLQTSIPLANDLYTFPLYTTLPTKMLRRFIEELIRILLGKICVSHKHPA